jgi:hypothetical protein
MQFYQLTWVLASNFSSNLDSLYMIVQMVYLDYALWLAIHHDG